MLLGPLVVVAALGIAWRLRSPKLAFVVLAFLTLLAPVMNIVPVYLQWQDRYLSLPILPLAFGLGLAVDQARDALAKRKRPLWPVTAVVALALGALAARTVQYERVWVDDETLFRHAAVTHPEGFLGWMYLCELRRDRGD